MPAPAAQPPAARPPLGDGGKEPTRRRRLSLATGQTLRSGALVALAVLITLFAVLNLSEVKVNWIFGSARAPLIIVIVISLLVGIIITYIAERLIHRRR